MEKIGSKQRQKMHREMCNNKWYVRDWQAMKFIRTENDDTGTGTFDINANNLYTYITRNDKAKVTWLSIRRNGSVQIHNWQHLSRLKMMSMGRIGKLLNCTWLSQELLIVQINITYGCSQLVKLMALAFTKDW
jgi:hypothetical protein